MQLTVVSAGADTQKEEMPEQELERLCKEKESREWAQCYTGVEVEAGARETRV